MRFDPPLPSPYYRVSIKGVITNDAGDLLLVKNQHGMYEMPGGGWEHSETLEEAFAREMLEELNVVVTSVSDIQYTYQQPNDRGYVALRLLVKATLKSHEFSSNDPDIIGAEFVSHERFKSVAWDPGEAMEREVIHKIFSLT